MPTRNRHIPKAPIKIEQPKSIDAPVIADTIEVDIPEPEKVEAEVVDESADE